jgi:hypothetical protein
MAGAYYIWILGACFLCTAVVIGGFIMMLRLGHWLDRRETGATHGFLELPHEFRKKEAGVKTGSDEETNVSEEGRQ